MGRGAWRRWGGGGWRAMLAPVSVFRFRALRILSLASPPPPAHRTAVHDLFHFRPFTLRLIISFPIFLSLFFSVLPYLSRQSILFVVCKFSLFDSVLRDTLPSLPFPRAVPVPCLFRSLILFLRAPRWPRLAPSPAHARYPSSGPDAVPAIPIARTFPSRSGNMKEPGGPSRESSVRACCPSSFTPVVGLRHARTA